MHNTDTMPSAYFMEAHYCTTNKAVILSYYRYVRYGICSYVLNMQSCYHLFMLCYYMQRSNPCNSVQLTPLLPTQYSILDFHTSTSKGYRFISNFRHRQTSAKLATSRSTFRRNVRESLWAQSLTILKGKALENSR